MFGVIIGNNTFSLDDALRLYKEYVFYSDEMTWDAFGSLRGQLLVGLQQNKVPERKRKEMWNVLGLSRRNTEISLKQTFGQDKSVIEKYIKMCIGKPKYRIHTCTGI